MAGELSNIKFNTKNCKFKFFSYNDSILKVYTEESLDSGLNLHFEVGQTSSLYDNVLKDYKFKNTDYSSYLTNNIMEVSEIKNTKQEYIPTIFDRFTNKETITNTKTRYAYKPSYGSIIYTEEFPPTTSSKMYNVQSGYTYTIKSVSWDKIVLNLSNGFFTNENTYTRDISQDKEIAI